jgi:hypothetical protein
MDRPRSKSNPIRRGSWPRTPKFAAAGCPRCRRKGRRVYPAGATLAYMRYGDSPNPSAPVMTAIGPNSMRFLFGYSTAGKVQA